VIFRTPLGQTPNDEGFFTPAGSELGSQDDEQLALTRIGGEERYLEPEGFEEEACGLVEAYARTVFGCYGEELWGGGY